MVETNGGAAPDELSVQQAQALHVLASALVDRAQVAARLGYQYGGLRDVYEALGWKKQLTWDDYYAKYRRQDIAGRIVDLPADATWRESVWLQDTDDPDDLSPFEAAWEDLDNRLHLVSWLHRLDRMTGIGEYAVMFLGVRGQAPETPLTRAQPGALMYTSVFPQPRAAVQRFVENPNDERFGLPEFYELEIVNVTTSGLGGFATIGMDQALSGGRTIRAHWSRVIHCAELHEDSRILGRPRLERVYNLLEILLLVVGGTGEAYWRAGRPRIHANIQPDYSGTLTEADREHLGEEIFKMVHNMQDWVRTSGTDIQQLLPAVADPRGGVEVVVDMIAAATGIPKRILLGSERGELASSQDAQEWAHRIAERQKNYAEPTIVRELVDRLIKVGIMPPATGGESGEEYEVQWPDLTGPNAEQRAKLAEQYTNAEARHANAELAGGALFTKNELRETLGFEPIVEIEEAYPGEIVDEKKEEAQERQDELFEKTAEREDQRADREAANDDDDDEEEEDEEEPAAAMLRVQRFGRVAAAVNAASDAIFLNATLDRILAAIVDVGRRVGERFGLVEVDVSTRATQDFLRQYGAERVAMISGTTREALAKELWHGARIGETDRQLAARVRKVFREASAGRALVIAATELQRAVNFGALEGMSQAGVQAKTWHTQGDTAVRPLHQEMAGQTVPVNQPFIAPNGEQGAAPGLFSSAEMSANCRCFVSAADAPTNLRASQDLEFPRRRAIHERRMLAAVRRALREQQAAVIAELR